MDEFMPIDLFRIFTRTWHADYEILDQNQCLYLKYFQGYGEAGFINGSNYFGQFANGFLQGKGEYTWLSGTTYKGDFKRNNFLGQAQISWPDGSIYRGSVLNLKKNGRGTLISNQITYQGDWVNDLQEGQGKLSFKNGSVFQGSFREGKRAGFGRVKYPSGNTYQGYWQNDMKIGKGVMSWINSLEQYKGDWLQNQQHGVGEHVWLEAKSQFKYVRNRYYGQWHKGTRTGLGVFFSSDGQRFMGNWINNYREGLGISIDEFGKLTVNKYEGDKAAKNYINIVHRDNQSNFYSKLLDYRQLIDTSNLKTSKLGHLTTVQILNNFLLRNNSQLKNLYRLCCRRYQHTDQNSYCLNLGGLTRLLKEVKFNFTLLTPSALNRILNASLFSRYESFPPIEQLRERLELVNRRGKVSLKELQFSKLINLLDQNSEKADWECRDEKKIQLKWQLFDVHDQKTCILFKQFIEFLIRSAVLAYNGLQLHKAVETHYYSLKESLQKLSTSTVVQQVKVQTQHTQANRRLFDKLTRNIRPVLNKQDRTVSVEQVSQILQKGGLLTEQIQRISYFNILELQFCLRQDFNQMFKKTRLKFQISNFNQESQRKVISLLSQELNFSQFNCLLSLFLQRKIADQHSKSAHYQDYLHSLLQFVQDKQQPQIPFPNSTKNFLRNEKINQRRQRAIIEEEVIRIFNERDRQYSQQLLMLGQDVDVCDQHSLDTDSQRSESLYQ